MCANLRYNDCWYQLLLYAVGGRDLNLRADSPFVIFWTFYFLNFNLMSSSGIMQLILLCE